MGFSTFPNNPFPPSTAQFDEGKNDVIQAEIDAIKDGINIDSFADVESALALKANNADMTSALATKTNLSNIAPAFNATSGVYAVGDKVIYDGVLYEFTSAHITAGEWDESEVQPVKVSELIDSLKSGLNALPYAIQLKGTETTSNTGVITVNTEKTLANRKVVAVSNFGADIATPYMVFVEAFVAGGTVSLRIRKYTDGTAVTETEIDMSKIVLFVA